MVKENRVRVNGLLHWLLSFCKLIMIIKAVITLMPHCVKTEHPALLAIIAGEPFIRYPVAGIFAMKRLWQIRKSSIN